MEENIIKQRALHTSNFTIAHNEILFQKLAGKPVSLETLGLFWRIMSFPSNWNLNKEGLKTICGCGRDKLKKCFKELEDLGYLKKVQNNNKESGKFENNLYYIYETINQALWNLTNETEIVDSKNEGLDENMIPQAGLPQTDNPQTDSPAPANRRVYNININKENKIIKDYKNLSESDLKVTPEPAEKQPLIINKNNNLTSLNSLDKINNQDKQNEAQSELNDSNLTAAEKRKIERRKKRELQHQEKLQQEQNKQKESVKDVTDKTIGDLTAADNIEARAAKMVNEAHEKLKQAELLAQKKKGIKKRILAKVDKDIQNQELAVAVKDYLSMWITTGKPMTEEIYNAQLTNLFKISRDEKQQIEIVKRSIQKGWMDLYPLENQNKEQNFKPNQKQVKAYEDKIKEEFGEDAFEIATDENGQALVF